MIEARIVSINSDSLKELGIRWGILDSNNGLRAKMQSPNIKIDNNLSVNLPAESNPASISFNIAKISSKFLDLELTAIEKENNAKIIASPKLLTINKKMASIKQGSEIPYVIIGKNGNENIEFREAVLGLEVTPQIKTNNSLLLELNISHNAPGFITSGSSKMTTINKQEINTQVIAKDGETVVLGGIYQQNENNNLSKVPILGDIPIIKPLFRNKSKQITKRELVIFVTPKIIQHNYDRFNIK